MPHLEDGFIHELLDGEVPSSQLGPIQQHLASCPECRARLDRARSLRDDVDGLIELIELPAAVASQMVVRPARSRPGWIRDVAWAATLVLAVGVGYVARGGPVAPTTQPIVLPPPSAPVDSPVTATSNRKPEAAKAREQPAPKQVAVAPLPPPPQPPPPAAASEQRLDALAQKASADRVDSAAVARNVAVNGTLSGRAGAAAAPPLQMMGGRGAGGGGRGGAARVAAAPIDTISLPEAMRRLGGSIRLIEGLVPVRLESQGPYVRIVYADEIVLRQQLVDGTIVFNVIGPSGFSADSLARLRSRVRE